jgi:hypothetical protein
VKYAACIRNLEENRVEILPAYESVDEDDTRYDRDIHLVPCPTGSFIAGVHDMDRKCACHVEIKEAGVRTLVIHNARVN